MFFTNANCRFSLHAAQICTLSVSVERRHFDDVRGVFRNNVDFLNNFTMLWSMVIKIISMCFRIFLPSFSKVWFSSVDSAQSNGLPKRVTYMNSGHLKCIHNINEVAIFWLMNFVFKEVHFLSNHSPKKQ